MCNLVKVSQLYTISVITHSQTLSSSTAAQTESQYSVYSLSDGNMCHKMETTVVVSTKACCFICTSTNKEALFDLPLESCLQVFIRHHLYISIRNRCCPNDMIKKRFYNNEISKMIIYSDEYEMRFQK